MPPQALRIAMIGSRGLPATWGGVERHVEELGARLVSKGHQVTVFARPGYSEDVGETFRGMSVRIVATHDRRGFEALLHSFNSAARTLGDRFDIVHFHAVGPGLASPLVRGLSRAGVVQTVHGLDADRDKWDAAHKAILRVGTRMSARVPHRTIVVSRDLVRHYRETYDRATSYIPNGVTPVGDAAYVDVQSRFGLEPGRYLLHVGRLVPEKAAHVLIEAFAKVPGDLQLVIAGGSSDTDSYVQEIRRLAAQDPRVRLLGYVFGDDLVGLYRDARAFVLPSILEGLPITLLEASCHRLPLVLSSIPPHVEVVGRDRAGARLAEPGSVDSLVAALTTSLLDDNEEQRGAKELSEEILSHYDWDAATTQTEAVYYEALAARRGRRAR